MSRPPLPAPLEGIVPPLVTPLLDGDRLDGDGLDRLVERLVAGGASGLFVLGTAGEAASLSGRLRREVIARTCRRASGRVPVLVGVGGNCVAESIDLARHAAEVGADAAVALAPFYLPLSQEELIAYALRLVAEQPLPLFLYNIPSVAHNVFEPAAVERLAASPRIVGIKDSSTDPDFLREVRRRVRRDDWSLLVGMEGLFARAVADGSANGCVGAGALIDPRLFADLHSAARRGDAGRVAALEARLSILARVYGIGPDITSIVRGLKCALSLLGVTTDRMADPFRPADPAEREAIRACLEDLGLPERATGA